MMTLPQPRQSSPEEGAKRVQIYRGHLETVAGAIPASRILLWSRLRQQALLPWAKSWRIAALVQMKSAMYQSVHWCFTPIMPHIWNCSTVPGMSISSHSTSLNCTLDLHVDSFSMGMSHIKHACDSRVTLFSKTSLPALHPPSLCFLHLGLLFYATASDWSFHIKWKEMQWLHYEDIVKKHDVLMMAAFFFLIPQVGHNSSKALHPVSLICLSLPKCLPSLLNISIALLMGDTCRQYRHVHSSHIIQQWPMSWWKNTSFGS